MTDKQETISRSQAENINVTELAADQLEKLNNNLESTAELSPRDLEARTEKARAEAINNAESIETKSKEAEKENKKSPSIRRGPISKKLKNDSYKKTIKQVQSQLSPRSRLFSKITHNKVIEKTSDIIGSTIAKPDAMLAGSVSAFVLTLITYSTAKIIGYSLSGSETIFAFIIGWTIGIIYDYFRVLFTGKKF